MQVEYTISTVNNIMRRNCYQFHALKVAKPHGVNRFICSLNKHSLSVNYVPGAIYIRREKDKLGATLI